MKDLVKYGAIGLGVYLLWPKISGLFGSPAAAVAASSGGATGSAPTSDTRQASQLSLRNLLVRWANSSGFPGTNPMLSEDQWCFGYAQPSVKSTPCPDPLVMFPGRDRSSPMSVDEFLAGATAAGLAGFGWGTF